MAPSIPLIFRNKKFRLNCWLVVVLSISSISRAENPFLWMNSGKPEVSEWTGAEWFEQVVDSSKVEREITATVSERRVARMSWGQIVRYRFGLPGELELDPLYFLVRDGVILELVYDDLDYLIGTVAAMGAAPRYEPGDVRGLVKVGRHGASEKPWTHNVTTTRDTSTYLATHPSGHFSKLIWKRGVGLIEYSKGNGARKDGIRLQRVGYGSPPAKAPFDVNKETIGGLKLGAPQSKAIAVFPGKPVKGKNEMWGADGEWHQDWSWPKVGAKLRMRSIEEEEIKQVSSIEIQSPSPLKTSRGIGIGDSESKAGEVYRDAVSGEESEPGSRVVVGSIFGGLIFKIEEDKVVSIFLGAAAE